MVAKQRRSSAGSFQWGNQRAFDARLLSLHCSVGRRAGKRFPTASSTSVLDAGSSNSDERCVERFDFAGLAEIHLPIVALCGHRCKGSQRHSQIVDADSPPVCSTRWYLVVHIHRQHTTHDNHRPPTTIGGGWTEIAAMYAAEAISLSEMEQPIPRPSPKRSTRCRSTSPKQAESWPMVSNDPERLAKVARLTVADRCPGRNKLRLARHQFGIATPWPSRALVSHDPLCPSDGAIHSSLQLMHRRIPHITFAPSPFVARTATVVIRAIVRALCATISVRLRPHAGTDTAQQQSRRTSSRSTTAERAERIPLEPTDFRYRIPSGVAGVTAATARAGSSSRLHT